MIQLARVFSDNMILQSGQETVIWGVSESECTADITLNGELLKQVSLPKGAFKVTLPPQDVMLDAELRIGDAMIKGVDFGEVWVASGQSNMEFLLKYSKDADQDLEKADDAHLRMYTVGQYSFAEERELGYKAWNPWDKWIRYGEKGTDAFSAVGLYFARKLREKGVPVGILNVSWGGTKAGSWTRRDMLTGEAAKALLDYEQMQERNDPKKYNYIKEQIWPIQYAEPVPGEGFNDILVKNTFYPNHFDGRKMMTLMFGGAAVEKVLKESETVLGKPLVPLDLLMIGPGHPNQPGALYDNMVTEVAGCSIRGVLWYQGCSDDANADIYDKFLEALINCWRQNWMEINPAQVKMPFIIVQLAPYGSFFSLPNTRYPELREAQERASKNIPDTYLTSITDVGNVFDIHPKEKKPVGERMFLLADKYVYGNQQVQADAPIGIHAERSAEDRITVAFEHGQGLYIEKRDFSSYNGFTVDQIKAFDSALVPPVLGKVNALKVLADGQEVQDAECSVCEDHLVITSAELIGKQNICIQFAKTGFYQVNLYNCAGLPARPFEIML